MINAMPRIAIAMNDFSEAVTTFRDTFGMPVVDFSPRTVPDLGAHVGMVAPPGGSMIELMSPANPDLPLSQAIQRFLDRRGEGFYALMLEAAKPDEEAEELTARGMNVLPLMPGASGRDIHPSSTHGVLIRVYPDGSVGELDIADQSNLGLSGIVSGVIATTDASKAAKAYGHGLGLAVGAAIDDCDRGVQTVTVTPTAGGTIELVSAIDTSKPLGQAVEQTLADRGEGLFSVCLRADDPAAAANTLAARGLDVGGPNGRDVTVFGARIQIV